MTNTHIDAIDRALLELDNLLILLARASAADDTITMGVVASYIGGARAELLLALEGDKHHHVDFADVVVLARDTAAEAADPPAKPIDMICPFCKVDAGHPCVRSNGEPYDASRYHTDRKRAADLFNVKARRSEAK